MGFPHLIFRPLTFTSDSVVLGNLFAHLLPLLTGIVSPRFPRRRSHV